jgi:hypothetical protein
MAKISTKVSFTNGIITKEDGVMFIEEFNTKGESQGRFNLSEQLDGILNIEGVKLSFDTTNELESEN